MTNSGGDPFYFDTIDETYSFNNFCQSLRVMQPYPSLLSTLAELECHR
jgi:hypothetical protein